MTRRVRRRSRAYRKPQTFTVAELSSEIKKLLAGQFPDVRVKGEITNCKQWRSGHWYFTLKDEKAQLSCVCFRGRARLLTTLPEHGLAVVAHGSIGVYEGRGVYQLVVDWIEPLGTGALQARFERLKAKLKAEGLFDTDRKRPLPRLPRRIGLVTSPTGAVIADMLKVLERRHPGLHIRLYPTLVQGASAAPRIAEGIRHFGGGDWAEVTIAGRGGGSLEDLWPFNEEVVARAIAASSVPVISAVGHETDYTIADFVADLRAPTPSAAAELVVPEAAALLEGLGEARARLDRAMMARLSRLEARVLESSLHRVARNVEHRLGTEGQRLDDLGGRMRDAQRGRLAKLRELLEVGDRKLARLDVRVKLARHAARLAELSQRVVPAMRAMLRQRGHRLELLEGRIQSLSPVAILERGYAIVRTPQGSIVRRVGEVELGDTVAVRLHDGELAAKVAGKTPHNRPE